MVQTIVFIEDGAGRISQRETMMPLIPVGVPGKDHTMEVDGVNYVIDKGLSEPTPNNLSCLTEPP